MAAQTIRVDGAAVSLFHLSLSLYGDALAWWALTQANGIADPWLSAPVLLTIPPAPAPNSGGLPPQT